MVREGYKSTEVGMIPEDWHVEKLSNITELSSSKRIYVSDYSNTGIPFYRGKEISELKQGKSISDILYITEDRYNIIKNRFGVPQCGDILITAVGTLGNIYRIPNNSPFYFKDGNLIWLKNININSKYLDIFLSSNTKLLTDTAIGSSQKALTIIAVKKIYVTIPTKVEQKNIAQALGDIDELITSLEKLLNKKKVIKLGAMQRLLKPTEDWNEVILGQCGRLYGGLSGKSKVDFINGNKQYIPFVNVMKNVVIDRNDLGSVNIANNETQNKIYKNDLIFNGSSETPEELGLCAVLQSDHNELYLNSFCFCYRLTNLETLDPLYLAYFCRSQRGRSIFQLLAQGATRYNLSKSNFKKIKFDVPSIDEQRSIAQTFSDMDNEIAQIEKRIAKARNIKEGMMQQLLTGAIRLL